MQFGGVIVPAAVLMVALAINGVKTVIVKLAELMVLLQGVAPPHPGGIDIELAQVRNRLAGTLTVTGPTVEATKTKGAALASTIDLIQLTVGTAHLLPWQAEAGGW